MDWDRPATKKHIKEAEAQGCKLIGAVENHANRLYTLPCGHEQEVQIGAMRIGNFRCQTCSNERLNQEAKDKGCKLIGAGRNTTYRLYELPCGHEQEIRTGRMCDGGFRCSVCMAEKLHQESEAQGCKLLGAVKNASNRRYTLPCGHEQEVSTSCMRIGRFRCRTCLNERLNQEAVAQESKLLGAGRNYANRLYMLPCGHEQEAATSKMRDGGFLCRTCLKERLNQEAVAQGCKLIGAAKDHKTRKYELPCGHEKVVGLNAMRSGSFRCSVCMTEKLNQEAEAQGCKLIGAGNSANYRLYTLPCGHEQEVKTGHMRTSLFDCQTCLGEKLRQEAEAQGCKLIGAGKDFLYRLYELPCGHKREVTLSSMRSGSFVCQTCEETSRTLSSNVYLLHIKLDSDEWLKLGYAKSVDFRVSRYGLPEIAEVTTVCSLPFTTGNEAHAVEADIHKRYERKRLPQRHMKLFHTKSGFEECYPVTMLETLLAELEALKSQQVS